MGKVKSKPQDEGAVVDRRAEDQAGAIGEGLAAGTLPGEERREGEPPLELPDIEPPAEDPAEDPAEEPEPVAETPVEELPAEEEPKPEMSDAEKIFHRIHDIIDQVHKNCDPADRQLLVELRGILNDHGGGRPGPE